ncbi:MAG: enoyl-CoA hydratase/isomerase family protein [Haloferacaceae archaeon]
MSPEMEHIDLTVEDGVGRLTIERPDHFNSFDVETAQDFRKAGLQLARDDDVRCGVIQGTGDVFCSGVDLRYIYEGGDDEELSYLLPDAKEEGDVEGYGRSFKQMLEYVHSAISEIRKAPKPFVAAVDGVAAAGGFGIAMSCDLVYASGDASFEWAYHKTGLTGAESSTFFLPRLVGFRTSMELMLRSPRLSAEEAVEMDLVNDVFPTEEFDERVDDIVTDLANGPTEAYGVAKGLINDAAGMDQLDPHLDTELTQLARIAEGRNFEEGIEAFFEKRDPEFEER